MFQDGQYNYASVFNVCFRMASTIMQVYLKHVLEAFFTGKSQVRLEALNVIQLVLRQGLVHPVQVCVLAILFV